MDESSATSPNRSLGKFLVLFVRQNRRDRVSGVAADTRLAEDSRDSNDGSLKISWGSECKLQLHSEPERAESRRNDASQASRRALRVELGTSAHAARQPRDRFGHPGPEHDGVVVVGACEPQSLGQGGGMVRDAGAEL